MRKVVIVKTDHVGEGNKVEIGHEAFGTIEDEIQVGTKLKLDGYVTGTVLETGEDWFTTKGSRYKVITLLKEEFTKKENNIFDGIFTKEGKTVPTKIDFTEEESRNLARKCSEVVSVHDDLTEAVELLLPRLTVKEIAFIIGFFMKDIKERRDSLINSTSPMVEFLRKLKNKDNDNS